MDRQRRDQDEAMLVRLRSDAEPIARAFGLRWRSLRRTRLGARLYGYCDSDGEIRIRLRSLVTGEFLKYSSLIETVCHELAHLRHLDHGSEFRALHREILAHARELGIYSPGRRRSARYGRVSATLAASAPRKKRTASRRRSSAEISRDAPLSGRPPHRSR